MDSGLGLQDSLAREHDCQNTSTRSTASASETSSGLEATSFRQDTIVHAKGGVMPLTPSLNG